MERAAFVIGILTCINFFCRQMLRFVYLYVHAYVLYPAE